MTFKILLLLLFLYLAFGILFYSLLCIVIPEKYKDDLYNKKVTEVIIVCWPLFFLQFFKRIVVNK